MEISSENSGSFWVKIKSLLGLGRQPSLKESLEEVIEEHNAVGDIIDPDEKEMLQNVLAFSEMTVQDIMVPRADIIYVDNDISFEGLKKFMEKKAHTRMPVCRKTLDDIAGFIHIKDLVRILCNGSEFDINKILRQALFVPPSMKINDLLVKMQLSRVHIALVIDEYGGTSGMATMEDLMEEIVGEIEDEHDITNNEKMLKKIGRNLYDVNARISIEELEKEFGSIFRNDNESEEFDTLGGLIFIILGRIPAKGEIATFVSKNQKDIFEFEVVDADARRVKKVLLRKKAT